MYIAGDAHVLLAKSLCGIYDYKHNVRPPYGAKGTYDAVTLDRFIVNGALAPDTRGVHQHKVIAVPCEWGIYGITGGAGYAAHYCALIAQQRVYQAGFADVRLAHYGDIYGLVLQLLLALGEIRYHLVQQIAYAQTLLGGYRYGIAYAQSIKVVCRVLILRVIHFIYCKHYGLLGAAQ